MLVKTMRITIKIYGFTSTRNATINKSSDFLPILFISAYNFFFFFNTFPFRNNNATYALYAVLFYALLTNYENTFIVKQSLSHDMLNLQVDGPKSVRPRHTISSKFVLCNSVEHRRRFNIETYRIRRPTSPLDQSQVVRMFIRSLADKRIHGIDAAFQFYFKS